MREIKFRAIDIYTKKFVYGQLVNVSCKKDKSPQTGWRIVQRGIDCLIHTPVDVETVGQFTGLHDKNGKEIWESDIVKYQNRFLLEVKFTCGIFHAGTVEGERLELCEIIGNIYENPELLGGGK